MWKSLRLFSVVALILVPGLVSPSGAAAIGPPDVVPTPNNLGAGMGMWVEQFAMANFHSGGGPGSGSVEMMPFGRDDNRVNDYWFGVDVWGPCTGAKNMGIWQRVWGWPGKNNADGSNLALDYTVDHNNTTAHLLLLGRSDVWSADCNSGNMSQEFLLDITLLAPSEERIEQSADPYNWCLQAGNAASSCMIMYRTGTTVSVTFRWCANVTQSGYCYEQIGPTTRYTRSDDEKIMKAILIAACGPESPLPLNSCRVEPT